MAIQINNGVTNIKNTPGAITDVIANLPSALDVANGTIFFAPDAFSIYSNYNGTWVLLSGGGGGTPNLQQVTDVNNITTANLQVDDGFGNKTFFAEFGLISIANFNEEFESRIYLNNTQFDTTLKLIDQDKFQSTLSSINLLFNNIGYNDAVEIKTTLTDNSIQMGDTANENFINVFGAANNERMYFQMKRPFYNFHNCPIYLNNAAALAAGLIIGDIYRISATDALGIVH